MSMAVKYAMKKRAAKMSEGCMEHGTPGCAMCYGGKMAEGGEVDDGSEGIVDRIMKRFSKGGEVANDTPVTADFEDNQFDDLVKDDNEETSYVDDGPGDMQEDDDRHDIVSRIMRSNKKKDRMPRPA